MAVTRRPMKLSIVMPVFPALSEVKRSVACGASATKFSSKVI